MLLINSEESVVLKHHRAFEDEFGRNPPIFLIHGRLTAVRVSGFFKF